MSPAHAPSRDPRAPARDRSWRELLRRLPRYVAGRALAPWRLRRSTSVGPGARAVFAPIIENAGRLEIGRDVILNSEFAPIELCTAPDGLLRMGDAVHINYGTSLRATESVVIGDGVSIGPWCILHDSESDRRGAARAPIVIGDGAWLASRVTVLPGARVGCRSVIVAGSVVSGEIPDDVVAGGIPARPLRALPAADAGDTPSLDSAHPTSAAAPNGIRLPALPAMVGTVLADFTAGDLATRLADPSDGPAMIVTDAPFCQTTQSLLTGPAAPTPDFTVVWTRPELAVPAFSRLLAGGAASEQELLAEVDAFADLVTNAAPRYRHMFVATWTRPAMQRGLGLLDARPGGLAWALAVMNHRLMHRLATSSNVYVLDAQAWVDAGMRSPRGAARAWYLGKVPYPPETFAEAARELKAAMRAVAGQTRKLLVLDLDGTLWGGVVGDVGWENLVLGGHDPAGEAFVDFQRAIKALARRGVLLAVVSKNTEEVALTAMRSHPEMCIRPEDLVAWRIGWGDKAQSVAELAAELNLGLQSIVFIDDHPVERARVRDALPEVYVPEWPEDPLLYPSRLDSLRCFDAAARTLEDASRTALYVQERERSAARARVGSVDDWLTSLETEVRVEPLGPATMARAGQLLNKTNQMNLATRRLSERELVEWSRLPGRTVLTLSVSDRVGAAGLTGILSMEHEGAACRIVDFVLSCRVMGRRVEELMLHLAVESARAHGAHRVTARLLPTAKNKPCHDFLAGCGFSVDASGQLFSWDAAVVFPAPPSVRVVGVGVSPGSTRLASAP
jgi:FkbH-like protein